MRDLKLFWRGKQRGTLSVPDSYRPPITQAELDRIPAAMIARSRSWLFDVREGDLRLELRWDRRGDEIVVVASDKLGSGDIGCLVGFRPAEGSGCFPDEEMIAAADEILRQAGS